MQIEICLPSLGDDDDAVAGGVVSEWLVKEGPVASGDDLLEITTDKAAFVLPAPRTGALVEKRVQPGDAVKVGDVLCIFEVKDPGEA
ncbi:MAG: lipoyl domain-containing protein [Candidatus Hydrogenedentes bacterium]|nr:lipoyl domain-containing protein [Candidatus Hydrogenedentota bacterium]